MFFLPKTPIKHKELTEEQRQKKIKKFEQERVKAYQLSTLDEYEDRLHELVVDFYECHLEENMRRKPDFHAYSMFDDDIKMTLDEFVTKCRKSELTSFDGYGAYASDFGISDILISPDDVLLNYYRKDMPYVCWYRKMEPNN